MTIGQKIWHRHVWSYPLEEQDADSLNKLRKLIVEGIERRRESLHEAKTLYTPPDLIPYEAEWQQRDREDEEVVSWIDAELLKRSTSAVDVEDERVCPSCGRPLDSDA